MFELNVFLRDKLVGRSVFQNEEVRIGRAADNEVQIDNLALSRYHASIENLGGAYVLKDFGSQNGTFVNGQRVEGRYGLNDGDRVSVGKFTLVFRCEKKATGAAEVRDAAAYAVAGETIVTTVGSEMRERPCPYVAFLESVPTQALIPPEIFHLAKDVFTIGSAEGSDLRLDAKACPPRAAAIIRGWRGFQLISLTPGAVTRNGTVVELASSVNRGDQILFGTVLFRYQVGRTDAGVS